MALDFETSSSQYVDFGLDIPALNGKAGATVTFWTTLESLPVSNNRAWLEMAVGPPPGTSGTSRLFITHESTGLINLGARSGDTGGSEVASTGAGVVSVGVLHFVAGVVDIANDRIRIYVDETEEVDSAVVFANATFPATNSKNGTIGSTDLGDSRWVDGIMEDVRLYSRALSAKEIQHIFVNRGIDGIVNGLEHRYPMDELAKGVAATGAGTIVDVGPRQRNLDPVASPVYAEGNLTSRRRVA